MILRSELKRDNIDNIPHSFLRKTISPHHLPELQNFLLLHFNCSSSFRSSDVALFVEERKLTAPLPGLSLHIVDAKGSEKNVFSLGEILRVQVRMSDESKFHPC